MGRESAARDGARSLGPREGVQAIVHRRLAQRHLVLGGLAGLAAFATFALGCGETARVVAPERGLHDPVASTRMAALREVSRTSDPRYLPDLIEMLDDEDPSIRLLAGAALEQMTGRDTGYLAHASPSERRAQVAAWRRWWDERQVSPGVAPPLPPSGAPGSRAPGPGGVPPPPPPPSAGPPPASGGAR